MKAVTAGPGSSLRPARGIMLGCFIGALMWVLILWVVL